VFLKIKERLSEEIQKEVKRQVNKQAEEAFEHPDSSNLDPEKIFEIKKEKELARVELTGFFVSILIILVLIYVSVNFIPILSSDERLKSVIFWIVASWTALVGCFLLWNAVSKAFKK
jgi:hypothetical protein